MEACLTTVSVAAPSRFHLLVILFQPTVRNSFPAGRKTLRELPKAPQDAWQGFGNAQFRRNGILFQADVPERFPRCLARFRVLPKAPQDAWEAFGSPLFHPCVNLFQSDAPERLLLQTACPHNYLVLWVLLAHPSQPYKNPKPELHSCAICRKISYFRQNRLNKAPKPINGFLCLLR